MFKRMVFATIALSLLMTAGIIGWTHCHDDVACEDLLGDLVGRYKWHESMPIDYWVSRDYVDSMPALYHDIVSASNSWSNIPWGEQTVNFRLRYRGGCEESPGGDSDNKNVVGWGGLGEDVYGESKKWVYNSNNRIVEADMILNYYMDWEKHGYTSNPPKFCIQNTAVHEFGHWVELYDLYDACEEYERYTMYGRNTGRDTHDKESLECEDKWAVEHIYGVN